MSPEQLLGSSFPEMLEPSIRPRPASARPLQPSSCMSGQGPHPEASTDAQQPNPAASALAPAPLPHLSSHKKAVRFRATRTQRGPGPPLHLGTHHALLLAPRGMKSPLLPPQTLLSTCPLKMYPYLYHYFYFTGRGETSTVAGRTRKQSQLLAWSRQDGGRPPNPQPRGFHHTPFLLTTAGGLLPKKLAVEIEGPPGVEDAPNKLISVRTDQVERRGRGKARSVTHGWLVAGTGRP